MSEDDAAQPVEVVGGAPYGVIGAGLHVADDGTLLYLLKAWRLAQVRDSAWLRQSPGRMLDARYAVVEFTGRAEQLGALRLWRDHGPRLTGMWLHGPAGAGKSRLVAQYAAECAAEGWKVVTAIPGPIHVSATDEPEERQDLRLTGAKGLLLIVDDADRRPHSQLTWLLSNALLHQLGLRTRIVLIGRSADAAAGARVVLAGYQADLSMQPVDDLPETTGERIAMFNAARDGFARVYGLEDPSTIGAPVDLADPALGPPLALHMAALAAVDAHAVGEELSIDVTGLTTYLLVRENLHWANLVEATPPEVMHRVVFAAALCGTSPRPLGARLLAALALPGDIDRILDDHRECYPPTLPGGAVLEPLYPDRLAEDLIALAIPGHDVLYAPQQWAPATATAVLDDGDPAHLARAITVLVAAAARWPHVGPAYLYPLLLDRPELAVEAGGAALVAIAALETVDPEVLEAIAQELPGDAHVELDVGAAAVAVELAPHRFAAAESTAEKVAIHLDLSGRLGRAGRFDEAVEHAMLGVGLARPDGDPALLERALNNLGFGLRQAGRREEALVVLRESAELNEARDGGQSGSTLLGIGILLSELGRRDEAITATTRAFVLFKAQYEGGDDTRLLDLASAANSVGILLADVDRFAESLEPAQAAVTLARKLVAEDPSRGRPILAASLTTLARTTSRLGRPDEGLELTTEAVAIGRDLAAHNESLHLRNLAAILTTQAAELRALKRLAEARSTAEEAVATYRRVAAMNPDAYAGELASALTSLGQLTSEAGNPADALEALGEATLLGRRLSAVAPEQYLPILGGALAQLGATLRAAGRNEEALAPTVEAGRILRDLPHERSLFRDVRRQHMHILVDLDDTEAAVVVAAEVVELDRVVGEPERLATSLGMLGLLLVKLGRITEARTPLTEAVDLHRRAGPHLRHELAVCLSMLARSGPPPERIAVAGEAVTIFRQTDDGINLADALGALTVALVAMGRHQEALAPAGEAVVVLRNLVRAFHPSARIDLVRALGQLDTLYTKTGHQAEALAAAEETILIRRSLAAGDRAERLAFGQGLNSLSIRLAEAGQHSRALAMSRESVDVLRGVVVEGDTRTEANLAAALGTLGARLADTNRSDSIAAYEESAALFRRLTEKDPAYQPLLDAILSALPKKAEKPQPIPMSPAPAQFDEPVFDVFVKGMRRYQTSADLRDLDLAIHAGRALVSAERDPARWSTFACMLGIALRRRYEDGHDPANYREAIEVLRRVSNAVHPGHKQAGNAFMNLGMVCRFAYDDAGETNFLYEAIRWFRDASRLQFGEQGQSYEHLASALSRLADERNDSAPLPEALAAARACVALSTPEQRSQRLLRLAGVLAHLNRAAKHPQTLREAIAAAEEATRLATTPENRQACQTILAALRRRQSANE